jgi:tetratricopeptide (TPR) repeat protein
MKKKIAIAILIVMILIIIKLFSNIAINCLFLTKYKLGKFSDFEPKVLGTTTILQSYVAKYNEGNVLYKKGDFEGAIEKYKTALERNILHDNECAIRVNYALSICKTVSVNEKDENSIKSAIEKYKSAVEILEEEECAGKEGEKGHSKEAEQLKADILNEIDRLNTLLDNKENKEEKEEKNNNEEDELEKKMKNIEEKIQEIKVEAMEIQNENENRYLNREFTLTKIEKNW